MYKYKPNSLGDVCAHEHFARRSGYRIPSVFFCFLMSQSSDAQLAALVTAKFTDM